MEFLILLILIIVFCLCLGLGPVEIFIGFAFVFLLLVSLTSLFFLYNIFRIVLSKRIKAVFSKVDASPKSRFTVAYYKSGDEEYPCIFPNEPMIKKILYKEGKEIVHRFVEINEKDGEICYITKGDANQTVDMGCLAFEDIKGIVKTKVPFVAYPRVFLSELFD